MKTNHGWVSAACCFLLFIAVWFLVSRHLRGIIPATGNSDLGLLFFIIPGATVSMFSHQRRVFSAVVGAALAAPVCLFFMKLQATATRSAWQEMAWVFSAVFWCALGALCVMCVGHLLQVRRTQR